LLSVLGQFPNIKPKPVYATAFTGTKLECNAPAHSPRKCSRSSI